jgi:hypothetical protein
MFRAEDMGQRAESREQRAWVENKEWKIGLPKGSDSGNGSPIKIYRTIENIGT